MSEINNRMQMIAILWLLLYATSAMAADIALDVGHSIRHPGATAASGAKELDLNRALASEIGHDLSDSGMTYHVIGADGKMDVLTDRTSAAQGDKLFLSVHHDSILQEWMPRANEFSGFSLFVSRKNPNLPESLDCAIKVGAQLIAAGFKPSRYHALPVKGQDRPFADELRGVHYFDDLIVLKTASQPAVLLEAGVIVNREDEVRVTDNEGRKWLAHAVALGVADCIKSLADRH